MKKGAEKILKYNDLTTEKQHTWYCKRKSDTGNNRSKLELSQNHSKKPQQHTEKARTQESTNKTAIFGTAYILLKVLT